MTRKLIFIATLMILSCGKSKNEESEANIVEDTNILTITLQQFDNERMTLGRLSMQDFDDRIQVNGLTDVPPNNKASINAIMGGYVKNTPLLVGDKVKKGQLLLTLENTEYVELQQQYLEVAEKLNYLKSEYERQQTLYDEKITSQKNFLKAESNYKSSLALYNGLKKKLQMMNLDPIKVEQGNISSIIGLYAPLSGSVTKVNVSNGVYVSPADEILEIVNTDHLHLELSVFEKDILKIKKEQKIDFKIPEASDSIFKAEVYLVGSSVDEKNRTVRVHAHIKNDDNLNSVTGMFVEAEIMIKPKNSYALPIDAVAEIDDSHYILILEDQDETAYTFKKVKVEKGVQTEAFIEILNAASFKNKKVLTKGTFMLITE